MQCPQCKSSFPQEYRYCLECGADMGAPTLVRRATDGWQPTTTAPKRPPIYVELPRRKSRGVAALLGATFSGVIIGLLIVVGLIAAYSVFTYFYDGDPLGITIIDYPLR